MGKMIEDTYIQKKNEVDEYRLCYDNSPGEKLDIALGPANSREELIDMAEKEWGDQRQTRTCFGIKNLD
jgi:hypothetical protein